MWLKRMFSFFGRTDENKERKLALILSEQRGKTGLQEPVVGYIISAPATKFER